MLKRRFIPYIVGTCFVVLLSASYIGYKAYQGHVGFERFIANAQDFNRSVKRTHGYSSKDHTHSEENLPKAGGAESDPEHHHHPHAADGKYVYEVAGVPIYANSPMSQENIEMEEWLITGKMTPAAEEYLKNRQKEERFDGQVIQRVVDPDGKIHTVMVPIEHQYEEGDAILRSELDVPEQLKSSSSGITATISINGTEYDLPDAYYAIEDRYERAQYQMKFIQSKQLGISMAEADRMVAAGEMDLSLSVDEKRRIDKEAEADARHAMLGTQIILPPVSDNPPVKVSFLPGEGEDARPGWMRKRESNRPSGSGEAAAGGNYSATDPFSEGSINEAASSASVGSDVPASPSDLPDIVKPISPQSVTDIEKQLTPQGIASELIEGLATSPADKAQQLIDQYGTAEGLRHLREMNPEAARQFERERSPKPPRDVSDGEASER